MIAMFTIFYLLVRWYQGVYGWSAGLDAFAPEYKTYWMNPLYGACVLEIVLFTSIGVYLWKTRTRDMDSVTPYEEMYRHFHHLVWLGAYSIAIYWGASFYSEQDATWHQSVIRDTDFTPSNIIKFYIAYPIYIITGWGAFMYARTRLPIFSKAVSLPYLIAVVGPFMNLPAAGLDAWGHAFWWMEELFVAPLHWGFAVFGWMVLGLMGVLLQIFDRMVGGELPERVKPPVEKRSGAAASAVSGGIVYGYGHAATIGGIRIPTRLPPGPPGPPEPPEPPEPPKGFFFFDLEGPACNGRECLVNSNVDLSFYRDVPTSSTARKAIGDKLAGIERMQISIAADGFIRLDDLWHQPFSLTANRNPQESRVVFHFRADNHTKKDAGFHVYLDHNGTPLYHFWIRVQVVTECSTIEPTATELPIDLDQIAATVSSRTRALTALLLAERDSMMLSIYREGKIGGRAPPLSLGVGQLHNAVSVMQRNLHPIASKIIWKEWDPGGEGRSGPLSETAEATFKSEVKDVAKQGWELRQLLCGDKGLKELIDAVESLPDGSRITMQTNTLGVPWDILYAKDPLEKLDAQAFWGMRYQIECLRTSIPEDGGVVRYAPGSHAPLILACVFDDKLDSSGAVAVAQRIWIDAQLRKVGVTVEYIRDCEEKTRALACGKTGARCIYVFCHGEPNEAYNSVEALYLEQGCQLTANGMTREGTFSARPLVILNACGAAAMSPLSGTSFSEQFIRKGAQGVVGALFSVPTPAAEQLGQALLEKFLVERLQAGAALAAIRRQWLARHNPIPLFYQLQCLLDAHV